MQQVVSTKPYLIRAIHEWCSDQGLTPYLVVAVHKKMQVPLEYAKNGEIVLNISYGATHHLVIDNNFISFSARFGDISRDVMFPIDAVISIFSKETGEGMRFEYKLDGEVQDAASSDQDAEQGYDNHDKPPSSVKHSHLKIVK